MRCVEACTNTPAIWLGRSGQEFAERRAAEETIDYDRRQAIAENNGRSAHKTRCQPRALGDDRLAHEAGEARRNRSLSVDAAAGREAYRKRDRGRQEKSWSKSGFADGVHQANLLRHDRLAQITLVTKKMPRLSSPGQRPRQLFSD